MRHQNRQSIADYLVRRCTVYDGMSDLFSVLRPPEFVRQSRSRVYSLLRNRCTLYSEIRCTLWSEIYRSIFFVAERQKNPGRSRPKDEPCIRRPGTPAKKRNRSAQLPRSVKSRLKVQYFRSKESDIYFPIHLRPLIPAQKEKEIMAV